MEQSRKKNAVRNFSYGVVLELISKILSFIVRTFFIKILSTEYLGVNGLFSNILTVLSFAELGFGTAIIYNMYKPVAEGDKEKIKSLMQLYKIVYNSIGVIIIVLGVCLIPFLDNIIGKTPNISENIILIYILFLINTSSSYFIAYKKSIISAYQQESINKKYAIVFDTLKAIFEILILVTTRNYIMYLLVGIVCTVSQNIALSIKANKMFPYLKEKNVQKINKEEKRQIFKNVRALSLYKFAGTILNGTDNIIISSLFGVELVGLCSNYLLIKSAVCNVTNAALNSIVASVGNLNVLGTKKEKEEVLYELFFSSFLIYTFCTVAILVLINPFIKIWIGEQYILSYIVTFSIGLSMFIEGMKFTGHTFRTTLGLFTKGRYVPVFTAIINIVLSIIMGKIMGVSGVFFATAISRILTTCWFDPYLIYKYELKEKVSKFYKKYVIYTIVFLIETGICYFAVNFIPDKNIITLICKGIIVLVLLLVMNILIFHKTNEYKGLVNKFVKPIINKIKSKKVKEEKN